MVLIKMVNLSLLSDANYILKVQKILRNVKNVLYTGLKEWKGKIYIWSIITLNYYYHYLLYYRLTNGDQITIFFDMMGSGLSNLDMDFTNYLINLLKMYYPAFLNYIIIYEMPWVLNGKTMLPIAFTV